MATTYTDVTSSWIGSYSGNKKTFQGWLEYTVDNSSNTQVTITINGYGVENLSGGKCTWQQGAAYFTISDSGGKIGTSLDYTKNLSSSSMITFTGAPKQNALTLAGYSAKTCTYTRSTSAYNVTITYRVRNTTTYWAGDKSNTVTVSIPILPSKTISYNANGGSGSVSAQTKYYGQTLKLASGGFSKSGCTLLGWNTSSTNTSSSAYGLGSNYTTNPSSNVVLYANWKTNYIKPTISNFKAYRAGDSGTAADPTGAYVYISFGYGRGKNGTTEVSPTLCTITVGGSTKLNGGTLGTSPVNYRYAIGETAQTVVVKVYDGSDSTGVTVSTIVPAVQFPIAINKQGTAMGIMHKAVSGQALTLTGGTVIEGNLQVTSINGVTVGSSPKFTDNNTTYSNATTSTAGLMSTTDKAKLDAVGTIKTATLSSETTISAYTSSNNNICNLCSLTLTTGKWLILGNIHFGDPGDTSAANNFRRAGICNANNSISNNFIQVHALGSYYTVIQVTRIVDVSGSQTFYLNGMSKQTCTLPVGVVDTCNFMKAIRIG